MQQAENSIQPVKIFYSYSHKDKKLRAQLETYLAGLRRKGLIFEWHDREIDAGEEWKEKIDANLQAADIVLLLISIDFINSDYCYGNEMKKALDKHESGKALVIPIILRPCDWKDLPFGKLQALPEDGKPITTLRNRETAFVNVAKGIQKAVEDVAHSRERRVTVKLDDEWNKSMTNQKAIIKSLQKFLAERGYYEDKIDGIPGRNTQKAVLKFQKETGLTADGLIGPETLKQMETVGSQRSPATLMDQHSTPDPPSSSQSTYTCHSCGANVSLDEHDERAYHCSVCGASDQWSD